jgi:peptide/nickel transport system substrate-binding protein
MDRFNQLKNLFNGGRITRRHFLKQASMLGVSVVLANSFINSSYAATPKKGGKLRVAAFGGATSDSLDPATLLSTAPAIVVRGQLLNNLVGISADGMPTPELATSWESPDAKKWVFQLRKGVEFHNGKPFSAEDVIFSLNHHRGEKSKSAARVIMEQAEDIKADGKYTVIIQLKEGNADYPFLMFDYHLGIMPAGTTDFNAGIGTGPFSLVDWEPGVRTLTKRNPNYWREGRPYFDEVETLAIRDTNARVTALKTGEVDIIDRVDPKIANLLDRSKDIEIIDAFGNQHYTMPMLTNVAPFDNNDVRLALKFAVDREELFKKVLHGHGSIGNDHPIGPTQRYFDVDLPQRSYDPDKARYHMKKAGLENYTFKLSTSEGAFPGAVDAAVLYKEQAAKAGINIEVVREPEDGYWKNVWMKKPWSTCYWGGRITEDWMFSTTYTSEAKWNDTFWKNERFDKLLKEARVELNKTKRQEMYSEMQRTIHNEGGVVIPLFASWIHAATSRLKHGKLSGVWPYDAYTGFERWWFEG